MSVEENQAQKINPWEVQGEIVDGKLQAINYNSLIEQFGTKPISDELLLRFERLTGRKPHTFLRRGLFFSHRSDFLFNSFLESLIVFLTFMRKESRFISILVEGHRVEVCTLVI